MSRRNRSGGRGGGIGRVIRWIIKVKIVLVLIILLIVGLVIWGIWSLISGLFRSSNLDFVTTQNNAAVVQVVDAVPSDVVDIG